MRCMQDHWAWMIGRIKLDLDTLAAIGVASMLSDDLLFHVSHLVISEFIKLPLDIKVVARCHGCCFKNVFYISTMLYSAFFTTNPLSMSIFPICLGITPQGWFDKFIFFIVQILT